MRKPLPASTPSRQRPSAAPKRRSVVFDAAAQVFATRGFHGASTQDVADVLGVRQASLYYYFRSKEEALWQVCARGANLALERARAACAPSTATSREKLVALIHAHFAVLAEAGDCMRVFLREAQHLTPRRRQAMARITLQIEECFENVIREGVRHGSFSPAHDPHLAMRAILGMLNAASFWRESRRVSPAQNARAIAQIALGGLSGVQWRDV